MTARKRKLAELYNVAAYAENCATEHYGTGTLKIRHQYNRDAFLEANDILS